LHAFQMEYLCKSVWFCVG